MTPSIIDAMNDADLFGPWFKGSSWDNWKTFLKVLFGLELTDSERERFTHFTGRESLPEAIKEAWLIVGRRGGKSLTAALIAVYLACFRDYTAHLAPGEVATVMVIAADRRQARVILRYIFGFFDNVPLLKALVANRTKESIELSNRVVIEVHTASFRSTRGYTIAAAVLDEVAFWRDESSATPDTEVIAAIRPGMATIQSSRMIALTTSYARRGEAWRVYRKHYAQEDSGVLVWKAPTREMNATVPQEVIDEAMERDPASAAAEYMAEFRTDIESYASPRVVDAAIVPGRYELPRRTRFEYCAFVDPAGGSGGDSMTLGISHRESEKVVVDFIAERRPPFSPEGVTEEFCKILEKYEIGYVNGDRYAGSWPSEQFQKRGVEFIPSELNKSMIYVEFLALLNSGNVELLDNDRLRTQLLSLERRPSRAGRDIIDHPPGLHDDVINAAAGAAVQISNQVQGSGIFL